MRLAEAVWRPLPWDHRRLCRSNRRYRVPYSAKTGADVEKAGSHRRGFIGFVFVAGTVRYDTEI